MQTERLNAIRTMYSLRGYELLQLNGRPSDLSVLRLWERASRRQSIARTDRLAHDSCVLSAPNGLHLSANVRKDV